MDERSKAEQDVIDTTDSYGGPVSEEELAEVYLARPDSDRGAEDTGGSGQPAG